MTMSRSAFNFDIQSKALTRLSKDNCYVSKTISAEKELHGTADTILWTYETMYSRMEYFWKCKICGKLAYFRRSYHFKFLKGFLLQILLVPLLNTLSNSMVSAVPCSSCSAKIVLLTQQLSFDNRAKNLD